MQEFRDGFGDLSAEFWLGHQRIHLLTSAQVQDSLLTIKNEHNNLFSMRYEWFMLEREDADYKLRYSSPDGDVDQLLVGTSFVTSGRDSDHGCGVTYGPYWHRSDAACLKSNLFGLYGQGGQTGTQWMGQDSGKVNFWQWKIKSSQGERSFFFKLNLRRRSILLSGLNLFTSCSHGARQEFLAERF